MDKNRNLLLAAFLTVLILLGWDAGIKHFYPQAAKPAAQSSQAASPAASPAPTTASAASSSVKPSREGGLADPTAIALEKKDLATDLASPDRVPIETQVFPVYDDGVNVGAVEIFRPASGRVYDDHFIEQLLDAATRDPLTNLPNRRYMQDYLRYKLYASRQFGEMFAVLFGDVDDFHQFNNTYGHDAGDSVLRNISRTFQENLRAGDRVARWGGEEFVGVFAVESEAAVPVLGQKICQLVRNTEIDHAGHPLHATMSIGITLMRPEDTVETMLARADALMYESKRKGKDCVTAG